MRRFSRVVLFDVLIDPGHWLSCHIQACFESTDVCVAVMIVAHILFAGPDQFHRVWHLRSDLGRLDRVVGKGPPPETATKQLVVKGHVGDIHVNRFSNFLGEAKRVLSTCPELALTVMHPCCAVHRLHRCVGKIGDAICGFDDLARCTQRRLCVACFEINLLATIVVCVIHSVGELTVDITLFDIAVAAGFVLDRNLVHSLSGLPVTIGDDSNGIAEVNDFANTGHILYDCRVDRLDGVAKHRRSFYGCVFHAGKNRVDAKLGGAVDFRRNVEPLNVCAHDREFTFRLEHRSGRK